jgi:conserved oligomeric Golgi complex subunit 6
MSRAIISPPALSPSPSLNGKADAWSSQARNPVSLRLYKVLGAKYDDEATKEALKTLSDFYAPASPPSVSGNTSKKGEDLDDWDESDSEDDDISPPSRLVPGASASTPSSNFAFLKDRPPGEVAKKARLNMRRDIERRLAEGSRKFLDAFGDVDQVCVFQCCPW